MASAGIGAESEVAVGAGWSSLPTSLDWVASMERDAMGSGALEIGVSGRAIAMGYYTGGVGNCREVMVRRGILHRRGGRVRGSLFENAWNRPSATMRPADQFVESVADFGLGKVAMALAINNLLDEVFCSAGGLDLSVIAGELSDLDDGVVDGVEGEHGPAEMAVWSVVAHEVCARLGRSGIAFDLVVQLKVTGTAGGVRPAIDEVSIVERIAFAATLHVGHYKGPVSDVVGEI